MSASATDAAEPTTARASGVIAAIPARYGSTRLPGKPLAKIAGKTMIEHVYRRVADARGLERTVVLTDDERVGEAVAAFGGEWEMTPVECASGTDCIAHAARAWPEAPILNIQGDEPLIDPAAIEAVATHLLAEPGDPVVTLASVAAEEILHDPNTVKVVRNHAGYALYFSRAAIPFPRQGGKAPVLQHLGIYGYQRAALGRLAALPPSSLEQSESLEQLRALENGISIRVLEVAGAETGVDTPEDLAKVEAKLKAMGGEGDSDDGAGRA